VRGLAAGACLRRGWGEGGIPQTRCMGGARLRLRVQPPSRRGFHFRQTVPDQAAQRPLLLRASFPRSLPAPRLSFLLFVSIFQFRLLPPRSHAALGRAHQHTLIKIQLIKMHDSQAVQRETSLFSRKADVAPGNTEPVGKAWGGSAGQQEGL